VDVYYRRKLKKFKKLKPFEDLVFYISYTPDVSFADSSDDGKETLTEQIVRGGGTLVDTLDITTLTQLTHIIAPPPHLRLDYGLSPSTCELLNKLASGEEDSNIHVVSKDFVEDGIFYFEKPVECRYDFGISSLLYEEEEEEEEQEEEQQQQQQQHVEINNINEQSDDAKKKKEKEKECWIFGKSRRV